MCDSTNQTDWQRALDGDETALTKIVTEKRPKIIAYIKATFPGYSGSSIAQEAFVALLESGDDLGHLADEQLWHWLLRASKYRALNRRRSEKCRLRHQPNVAELSSGRQETPEDLAIASEDIREIENAIRELPESLRRAAVLRILDGTSNADVADDLDISETAAKQRIHRARARLRETLVGKFDV